VAHAGEREKRGELGRLRERREGERWATGKRAGPRAFGAFFSFSFPTLKLFKQFYLNSNKFEFKPYTPNTIKTMRRHECTSKLIL
jgi:hypothetical protein